MMRSLAYIVVFIPLNLSAQVSIVNRSLVDSSLNVAYLGLENAIELIGLKNNKEPILFSTTNGTITDLGQNRYLLRPFRPGECTVNFQTKKQKLAAKTFKADTLGEMIVRLAGVKDPGSTGTRDSYATVQQIVSSPFLVVEVPGTFYKHKCQVTSFVLSMDGVGFEDSDIQEEIIGYLIPERIVDFIKNRLRKGNVISFENIYCTCADGSRRKLQPFTIMIK
jgi:hypothetical protein